MKKKRKQIKTDATYFRRGGKSKFNRSFVNNYYSDVYRIPMHYKDFSGWDDYDEQTTGYGQYYVFMMRFLKKNVGNAHVYTKFKNSFKPSKGVTYEHLWDNWVSSHYDVMCDPSQSFVAWYQSKKYYVDADGILQQYPPKSEYRRVLVDDGWYITEAH